MERFLERHKDAVFGILSGFDRVLFRGTLRSINYGKGMEIFLSSMKVLFKNFSRYAQGLSKELVANAEGYALQAGRPFIYMQSSRASKEELVKEMIERDDLKEGLVCVLRCVEPCRTWTVRGDRASKHLGLRKEERKCLFLYFYFLDPQFGLLHVRLQSWFPFDIQVCLNGREYLARQMSREKIDYAKVDNCFTRIENLKRAQVLLDRLETYPWIGFLNRFVKIVNPLMTPKAGLNLKGYYWSIRQCEYASDVMFHDSAGLSAIYPTLTNHAINSFGSDDVLRFLGQRTNSRFMGRVESNLIRRLEGVRVKHWVEENSIKMYDKAGSVLRIETTINNPRRFRVRRKARRKGRQVKAWLPMRKGIADTKRRVELCRAINNRYLDALSVIGTDQPSYRLMDSVSKRLCKDGRCYRALRPISPEDSRVFKVMMRGEFLLQGFRNGDLRAGLQTRVETDPERLRKDSQRITRLLRLWTAHGLIYRVVHTNYYRITWRGRQIMATALEFRRANTVLLAA
jgi:hypothetical protein